MTTAILERALSSGDLTRAGVLAAARQVRVDLKGLGPEHSWAGSPNDNVVRETFLYTVDPDARTGDSRWEIGPAPEGSGLDRQVVFTPFDTVSDVGAALPYQPLREFYTSSTAAEWQYRPCHVPGDPS